MGTESDSSELNAAPPRRRRRSALRRLGAAATLVLLSACGGGSGEAAPPEPARPWLVLGSSTAAGVGATAGNSWASLLDAALRAANQPGITNRAKSGATTYQALPAAATRPAGRPATDPTQDIALALEARPPVVVLAFPSNDALLGYSVAETTANLLQLRELAVARGARVIVLSTQPRDDATAPARAAMLETDAVMSAAVGACFVAVRADLSDASGRIAAAYSFGDGIHLNNAGHRLVFDRLWAAVRAGGCVTPP